MCDTSTSCLETCWLLCPADWLELTSLQHLDPEQVKVLVLRAVMDFILFSSPFISWPLISFFPAPLSPLSPSPQVPPSTLDYVERAGVSVTVLQTEKAVAEYNRLVRQGAKVGGVFHSTCWYCSFLSLHHLQLTGRWSRSCSVTERYFGWKVKNSSIQRCLQKKTFDWCGWSLTGHVIGLSL